MHNTDSNPNSAYADDMRVLGLVQTTDPKTKEIYYGYTINDEVYSKSLKYPKALDKELSKNLSKHSGVKNKKWYLLAEVVDINVHLIDLLQILMNKALNEANLGKTKKEKQENFVRFFYTVAMGLKEDAELDANGELVAITLRKRI